MAKEIVWKEVLAEAEELGQTMFGYIADNTSSPGNLVIDENGEKVTAVRWAEALGMSEPSMRRYIRRSRGMTVGSSGRSMGQQRGDARRFFRTAPVEEQAALVREAVQMHPEVARAAFRAAAPTVSEADRKAAAAGARSLTAPIREAVAEVQAEFVWAEQLNDIADEIAEYEGKPSKRAVTALLKASGRVSEEVQVLVARMEMERADR